MVQEELLLKNRLIAVESMDIVLLTHTHTQPSLRSPHQPGLTQIFRVFSLFHISLADDLKAKQTVTLQGPHFNEEKFS